jgi:hypothetical protein
MPRLIPTEALPRETAPLTAAIQPLEQQPSHRMLKAVQCTAVVGDAKVVEVPAHLGVPGATEQETTIRGSTVKTVEEHAGLHPCLSWTKTRDIVNIYRCIVPVKWIFFHGC